MPRSSARGRARYRQSRLQALLPRIVTARPGRSGFSRDFKWSERRLSTNVVKSCQTDDEGYRMRASTSIRIEQSLYDQAKAEATVEHRTIAGQIEYWAKVGRAALGVWAAERFGCG